MEGIEVEDIKPITEEELEDEVTPNVRCRCLTRVREGWSRAHRGVGCPGGELGRGPLE